MNKLKQKRRKKKNSEDDALMEQSAADIENRQNDIISKSKTINK